MTASLRVGLQALLPQRLLGALVYRIARTGNRVVKNALIRWFSGRYAIDMSEAELASPADYPTFNAFFTRALKSGARPVDAGERSIVSPADGRLTEYGTIDDGTLLQAKGIRYRIEALLGEQRSELDAFIGGSYATVYLAPRDYHRVHAPAAGGLTQTRYIPGRRFAVNEATASVVDRLFCRNERVVCHFEGEFGRMAVVLVGALNVASISTARHGELPSGRARQWDEPVSVAYRKGEEIGRFNLGSTVIVVFERDAAVWNEALESGQTLRMGMPIGTLTARGETSESSANRHVELNSGTVE